MDNPVTYVSYGDFGFKGEGFITPYVSRNHTPIYYGIRSGLSTDITLEGQITGLSYNDLIKAQSKLISGFSKDFLSLDVREKDSPAATELTSVQGFPVGNCIIESISFEDSNYNGLLGYTISLRAYESRLFVDVSKVLDPVNSFTFSEADNGEVSVSHSISAKGISTSASGVSESNALDNAKSFVLALTGWNNQVLPALIKKTNDDNYTNISPSLKSQTEGIARMNGIYSVSEEWVFDKDDHKDFSRTVSVDINSGINDDFVLATVRADWQGDKSLPISALRNNIGKTGGIIKELYEIASDNFDAFKVDATRILNEAPTSLDVNESEDEKTISISAVFSDNNLSPYKILNSANAPEGHPLKRQDYAYFDYKVDLARDEITSSTNVSIKGSIVGIGGGLKNRYSGAYSFLDELHDAPVTSASSYRGLTGFLYLKAKGVYDLYYSGVSGFGLNQRVDGLTVDYAEYNGRIDVSASFDDADRFHYEGMDDGLDSAVESASYSISVSPSIPMIVTKAIITSEQTRHGFYDLGVNKKTDVQISCNLKLEKERHFNRENLSESVKYLGYNLRKTLKEKYVDDRKQTETKGKIGGINSFVRINSESNDFNKFGGTFNLNADYSFNEKTPYIVKRPGDLGANEDPLTIPN